MRPLIMNGIHDVATRHDLADRAILIPLSVIEPNKRKTGAYNYEEFTQAHPRLLGALCDAVSCA